MKAKVLGGSSVAAAIREVAAEPQVDSAGRARRVGVSTLYRWYKHFESDAASALEDALRERTQTSCVLSNDFLSFLKAEKNQDPDASVPELIRRAREYGIVKACEKISRASVYRACKRMNLPLMRQPSEKHRGMRRFAYKQRMQMVLCDGKHFRAGATRKKRVAFYFLDDATRFCLHVVVGTSETKELFLRGLYETLERYGKMSALYVDNGAGFIADWSRTIAQSIGIALIHGTSSYPEGHGKIERFNRTASNDLLKRLDCNPEVDPALSALDLRLQYYAANQYNQRGHESLAGRAPAERFNNDERALRFAESSDALKAKFTIYPTRKVSRDNVVSIDGQGYDMPLGYAGRRVTLHCQVLDGTVAVKHGERLVTLKPVDLYANALTRRTLKQLEQPAGPPAKSAAELAYKKKFNPLVAPDGGYLSNEDKEKE